MLSRGFALIEMMISLALSLIFSLLLIQLYQAYLQAEKYNQALAELQENGRIILQFLQRDLSKAGFFGCGKSQSLKSFLLPLKPYPFGPAYQVRIIENQNKIEMTNLQDRQKPGQSMLIEFISDMALFKRQNYSNEIEVFAEKPFIKGQKIVISSCEGLESHTLIEVLNQAFSKKQILTLDSPISLPTMPEETIAIPHEYLYSLKDNYSGVNRSHSISFSLLRRDLLASFANPDQLVSGIYDLNFDLIFNPSAFLPTQTPGTKALSFKTHLLVDLLLHSDQPIYDIPHTFTSKIKNQTFVDRRQLAEFASEFVIMND